MSPLLSFYTSGAAFIIWISNLRQCQATQYENTFEYPRKKITEGIATTPVTEKYYLVFLGEISNFDDFTMQK